MVKNGLEAMKNNSGMIKDVSLAIGIIVTLVAVGVSVGYQQKSVTANEEKICSVNQELNEVKARQSVMQQEFAFLRGVVNTKLDTIQENMVDIKEWIKRIERITDESNKN